MNKCELFEQYIIDICGKTRTRIPRIIQYRLREYAAWCDGYKRISHHPMKISECSNKEILSMAAHEVGHIRVMTKVRKEAEYRAELFALKVVHKYYPKLFTLFYAINIAKENRKIYYEPFKRAIRDFEKWRRKQ